MNEKSGRLSGLKVVGGIFFALLLMLIFLSNTIYTYNQPTVTATTPLNGRLNKIETVGGMAQWTSTTDYYTEAQGKISEVLVKEGDRVSNGQELVRLEFDIEDIEQRLKEIDISRRKNDLDIENIHMRIERTKRNITDLENEIYKTDQVSDYDIRLVEADIKQNELEIEQADSEIARLEEELKGLETIYEAGGVSLSEVEAAKRNIQSSYDKKASLITKRGTLDDRLDNTRRNIQDTRSKNSESVEKQETSRTKQLADYQADLASMDQELKAKELDKLSLDLQEETQRKTLEKYDNGKVICATEDSSIISLSVSVGQRVNEGQLVAVCGLVGEYEVLCRVSLDNNFIAVGDTCRLENSSFSIEGVVTNINPTEQTKEITVLIGGKAVDENADSPPEPPPTGRLGFRRFGQQNFGDVNDITAGESFDVTFEKTSTGSYILVPNGALNIDGNGYFVYQVKQRDGILGKELYLEKLYVYIGDSDSDNTIITRGITFFEPIVLLSDKGITEGGVVKLMNEGDFFAD
ncbi:MAG: hypothetical protein FWH55_03615 [Oscillospiraceae bacterium]|nr:hypothetical protein [Oscillospiraceae bacterium]